MSHPILERLNEQRLRAWESAKALLDDVEARSEEFTAAEDEQWTRINEEIATLDKRIADITAAEEAADAADRRAEQYPTRPAGEPADNPTRDADILRSMALGEIRGHTFERRDLSKLTAAAGGNVVPTGFVNRLYQHLIEDSAIRQTNVTVLTTTSGEKIQVPKTTAHGTAALTAEADPIAESDPTFGQAELDAYKYAVLIQLSNELMVDSGVDIEGYIAAQAGAAVANASGAHFITGTGSGQPNGVITAATVGQTGGAGVTGAFTSDDLIDLQFSVISKYRGRAWWMFSDTALAAARKLKDTTDQYLWQPSMILGQPDMLLGKPLVSDPNVAVPALSAKSVAFGDFSAYYIRDVAGIRVERSDDYAFANDLVTFRVILRTDGELVDQTGAVKVFQGNAA